MRLVAALLFATLVTGCFSASAPSHDPLRRAPAQECKNTGRCPVFPPGN
jgi:hypothetical protein